MPRNQWSPKRERQYAHVKSGLLDAGKPKGVAEEIAARVVNKERARKGEAKEASRSSLDDMSPSRRAGLRSHSGAQGKTYEQLYDEARQRGLKGRSHMNKAALQKALDS